MFAPQALPLRTQGKLHRKRQCATLTLAGFTSKLAKLNFEEVNVELRQKLLFEMSK